MRLEGDTPEALQERVLAREHSFFSETLQRIVLGDIELPEFDAYEKECRTSS